MDPAIRPAGAAGDAGEQGGCHGHGHGRGHDHDQGQGQARRHRRGQGCHQGSGWRRGPRNQNRHRGASCHGGPRALEEEAGLPRLVLAGNPNTGKSVVFGRLTGLYADVSNYPGTTVDLSTGTWQGHLVIDTPGVYGIGAFSDDERVTRDVVSSADVVLNVVDAVHLQRDLFLTQQLIDMGLPMVVLLNMVDEARVRGIVVNPAALEAELGVPVIPVVAVTGEGFERLPEAIRHARRGKPTDRLRDLLDGELEGEEAGARALRLMELEGAFEENALAEVAAAGDGAIRNGTLNSARTNGVTAASPVVVSEPGARREAAARREEIYRLRRLHVNAIYERVVAQAGGNGPSLSQLLGEWSMHPVKGVLLLGAVLFALYELVGVLVAQTVVDFTEGVVMDGWYRPWIASAVGRYLSPGSALGQLLVGEFGVLTMTVAYVLGLLLPLVFGFYVAIAFLEDSGYLPRIAVLVDRWLNRVGLNGRAVIPTILGFGCVTMATMTTRILSTRRERLIASTLLAIAIPCSAQLAVIGVMLLPLGPGYAALYAGLIFAAYVAVGTLLNRALPGQSSDLLIDLPAMRLPRWSNVLRKSATKTWGFVREAGPIFLVGAAGLSVLQITGALQALQRLLAPLTVGWLGLPREAARAFIMGFVRRDFGVAGLYDLPLTAPQTITALVTITLFVPCIASMMMLGKENGWRTGALIAAGAVTTAFAVGGLVHQGFRLLGVG